MCWEHHDRALGAHTHAHPSVRAPEELDLCCCRAAQERTAAGLKLAHLYMCILVSATSLEV